MPKQFKYLALFVTGFFFSYFGSGGLLALAYGGAIGLVYFGIPLALAYAVYRSLRPKVRVIPEPQESSQDLLEIKQEKELSAMNSAFVFVSGMSTGFYFLHLFISLRGYDFNINLSIFWGLVYLLFNINLYTIRYFNANEIRKRYERLSAAAQANTAISKDAVFGNFEPQTQPAPRRRFNAKYLYIAVVLINIPLILGASAAMTRYQSQIREIAEQKAQEEKDKETAKLLAPINGWEEYVNEEYGFRFPYPPEWGEPVLASDSYKDSGTLQISFTGEQKLLITLRPKIEEEKAPYFMDSMFVSARGSLLGHSYSNRLWVTNEILGADGSETGEVNGSKAVTLPKSERIEMVLYSYTFNDYVRTCYTLTKDENGRNNYKTVQDKACDLDGMEDAISSSIKFFRSTEPNSLETEVDHKDRVFIPVN